MYLIDKALGARLAEALRKAKKQCLPVLLCLLFIFFGETSADSQQSNAHRASENPENRCVIIDTDFDIDDMMAVPMVVAKARVVAIVSTEGATRAAFGASALARLLAQPGHTATPVIVGASAPADRTYRAPPWLAKTRATMEHMNDFQSVTAPPRALDHPFEDDVLKAAEGCAHVTVLVIDPWTSFVRYAPRLSGRIDRVVAQGRPAYSVEDGDNTNMFNCAYDLQSCKSALPILKSLSTAWVDIPRGKALYNPTERMVGALRTDGISGSLRAALFANEETWVPTADVGYGKSLLWDQLTALYLLEPDHFHRVGAHMEPDLDPDEVRRAWIENVNTE